MTAPTTPDCHPERTWSLVWTNLYSFLLQTLQVGLVGPFIALKLAYEHHSPALSGLLVAIIWGLVIVLGYVTPAIIHRLGISLSNFLSIGLTVVGFACLTFFNNTVLGVIGAILIGTALTIRWISCDALVIQLSNDTNVGRNVGIHETLMGGGIAVGPLMLWLSNFGYSYIFYAVLSVALAAVFSWTACLFCITGLRDESIIRSDSKVSADTKARAFRILRLALLSAFTAGFIEASFVVFLPAYVVACGYTAAAGGVAGFLFGFGGTLLQPVIGHATACIAIERVQRMCVEIIVASLCSLIAITALGLGPKNTTFGALVFLAGGFIGGANTLAVIDCGIRLEFPLIEYGVARIAMAYTVGAVAGPLIIGVITAAIGQSALLYICAVFAVSLLLILHWNRPSARG